MSAPDDMLHETGSVEPLPPNPLRRCNRVAGFLRFALVYSFTCFWTCVIATGVVLIVALSRRPDAAWIMTQAWSLPILRLAGVKVEVHVEKPLPDGPVIFASNHQSMFDIVALFVGLPRPFVFVAKKAVFGYPMMGAALKALRYIPVDRSDRQKAIESLREAADRVRDGLTVTVFPEGTRSDDGSILPFKKGPFMLAFHAGVPIVPVAIEGALDVNPKRRWYICPNTIRILVGPAVPTKDLHEADRDALIGAVRSNVIRMHRRLGGMGGDEKNHIAAAGFEGIGRAEGKAARSRS